MKQRWMGLLELHAAVLLFGLAGLFGKFVSLSPLMIVLGRTAFAAATLIGLLLFQRTAERASGRTIAWMGVAGAVLAFHWVSFFQAIQISTVAVGLLTFSSFPLFVTVLEPVVFRERFRAIDGLTAGLVLVGLWCIVPKLEWSNRVTQGAAWGVASGLSFAILSLLNRGMVARHSAVLLAAGQNLGAMLVLVAAVPMYEQGVSARQLLQLAFLGVFCTALAHTLFIRSLARVRAQLASVVSGLEAVYGVGLAFGLLGERPEGRTLVGGGIILLAVLIGTTKRPAARERGRAEA